VHFILVCNANTACVSVSTLFLSHRYTSRVNSAAHKFLLSLFIVFKLLCSHRFQQQYAVQKSVGVTLGLYGLCCSNTELRNFQKFWNRFLTVDATKCSLYSLININELSINFKTKILFYLRKTSRCGTSRSCW